MSQLELQYHEIFKKDDRNLQASGKGNKRNNKK